MISGLQRQNGWVPKLSERTLTIPVIPLIQRLQES